MLQNCSILRVAGVFFDEPTKKHYLKEISGKAGLAHTSVKKYLEMLKNENIIRETVERRGERDFPTYFANNGSNEYRREKIISNMMNLFRSGLIEYIIDNVMPNSIILFGSYSRGEDTEDSDIDLFVEAKEQKTDTKKFEEKLKRKIQLHFREDINDCPNELKNNIINGFSLFGATEVFK